MPVRNFPNGLVGLHELAAANRTIGDMTLPATFLITPRSGKNGLISLWSVQSTNAGRTVVARNVTGFAAWISARASSASPLTFPKKGVKRPGVKVAPSPET
jgi:hypothetical protein